jgi:hypothetical protein
MATERLTISCDDCVMAGTTACTDCLVTFVVGGPLQVLPGGADEIDRSIAAHPAGRSQADHLAPAPVGVPPAPAPSPSPSVPAPVGVPPVPAPAGAGGGPRRVRLSAEQADAVRTLAGAGLVGAVRFVPRAAG